MRRLLFALGVLAAVAATACGGSHKASPPAPKNGSYTNSTLRYTFQYPKDWPDISKDVKVQVQNGTVTPMDKVGLGGLDQQTGLISGALVSVVHIDHQVQADNIQNDLNAQDDLFRKVATDVKGKLTIQNDVQLGGLPAHQYLVEFVYAGQINAVSAQTITFFGDRQYTVDCEGPADKFNDTVKPGCEQILQSFRFK